MYYLDTSVLVALYLPEPGSPKAQMFCAGPEPAAISALTEVEFHSALSRRARAGELSRDDALKVVSNFKVHLDDRLYQITPVAPRDYALARDWLGTFRTPLRTLDAIHLAVTFSNGFIVVTADRILAESARHFGVKHKLIS